MNFNWLVHLVECPNVSTTKFKKVYLCENNSVIFESVFVCMRVCVCVSKHGWAHTVSRNRMMEIFFTVTIPGLLRIRQWTIN